METQTTKQVADRLCLETTKLNIQKQITADLKFKLLNLHKINYCMSACIKFTVCSCGKVISNTHLKTHKKSKFHDMNTTE
tara:strand:- start:378 stop:617 length:240 start_codon:yes stop_codon:yes gene_type:complete